MHQTLRRLVVLVSFLTATTATADPLAGAPGWTDEGGQESAELGRHLAPAGDVDGDGYEDVLVAAPSHTGGATREGRVQLHRGGPSGLTGDSAWAASGGQAWMGFGDAVAAAGDVNGDGYDDVLVGAHAWDHPENGEGGAWLFLGGPSGLAASPAWQAEGNQANANFGAAVSGAGDVNGDGYDDVLVGAWGFDEPESYEGKAWLYLGSASGLSTTAAWSASPDQANAFFGVTLAAAGDVNGDGYDDVAIGASRFGSTVSDEGAVFVFAGSASGLGATPLSVIAGGQSDAAFGLALARGADVNGDGYDDVLVGSRNWNGAFAGEGTAALFLGGAGGLAADPLWTDAGGQAQVSYGASVALLDADGDGFADVAVAGTLWDGEEKDAGHVRLFRGGIGGPSDAPDWTAFGSQAFEWFGIALASADVDGNGRHDLLVGASGFSGTDAGEGRAYLYLSGTDAPGGEPTPTPTPGETPDPTPTPEGDPGDAVDPSALSEGGCACALGGGPTPVSPAAILIAIGAFVAVLRRRRAGRRVATTGVAVVALASLGAGCTNESTFVVEPGTYLGREFFAVDLDNFYDPNQGSSGDAAGAQFGVSVSNPHPSKTAHVTVEDRFGDVARVEVGPRDSQMIELPRADVDGTALVPNAYRIESSIPVTAHQFNPVNDVLVYSNDASLLLPAEALDSEYFVLSWPKSGFAAGAGFLAVAAVGEGETTVTIEVKTATAPGGGIAALAAGETITRTLSRHDVLALETLEYGTDLTGSRVTADRPIAVFGGAECALVPLEVMACDHLEEQLFPVRSLGSHYVAAKSQTRFEEPDIWRVLAVADGTEVITVPVQPGTPRVLDAGQFLEIESDGDFRIESGSPVMVGQYLVGETYFAGDTGDPSMILAVPVEQFLEEYVFLTPSGYDRDSVTVVAPRDADVELDGLPIDDDLFKAVPDSTWKRAIVDVGNGVHRLSASAPVGLTVTGYDDYVSYGYPGGLDLRGFPEPASSTP